MSSVTELIKYTLQIGFILLSLGKLPQVTFWIVKQIVEAQPKMLRLGDFNRALFHPTPRGGRNGNHKK